MKPTQVRATIPPHLQQLFYEVGKRLNTTDPSVINTHILSCYFTGDRTASASQPLQTPKPDEDPFDGLIQWGDDETL